MIINNHLYIKPRPGEKVQNGIAGGDFLHSRFNIETKDEQANTEACHTVYYQ